KHMFDSIADLRVIMTNRAASKLHIPILKRNVVVVQLKLDEKWNEWVLNPNSESSCLDIRRLGICRLGIRRLGTCRLGTCRLGTCRRMLVIWWQWACQSLSQELGRRELEFWRYHAFNLRKDVMDQTWLSSQLQVMENFIESFVSHHTAIKSN